MLSTKIICTIGPASDSPDILAELAAEGMNVARLNFSHGTHKSHLQIIEKIRELNKHRQFPIAVLLDTQGPEIRTGDRETDGRGHLRGVQGHGQHGVALGPAHS